MLLSCVSRMLLISCYLSHYVELTHFLKVLARVGPPSGRQGTCLLLGVLSGQLIVLESYGVDESQSEP